MGACVEEFGYRRCHELASGLADVRNYIEGILQTLILYSYEKR